MHFCAIRAWCRWLMRQGWLRSDPSEGVSIPKCPKRRRLPVPEDAIPRLMDACDRLPRTEYRRVLAKAALSLLVYGGLRRGCRALLRRDVIEITVIKENPMEQKW